MGSTVATILSSDFTNHDDAQRYKLRRRRRIGGRREGGFAAHISGNNSLGRLRRYVERLGRERGAEALVAVIKAMEFQKKGLVGG